MDRRFKIVGGLSGKAKFNIAIAIFLLFAIITTFSSINQIRQLLERRKEVTELQEKLSWYRNENIELLALEKSLYGEDAIELEARKQFNMAYEGETNISVVIEDSPEGMEEVYDAGVSPEEVYSNNDLWGNIRIFYVKEILEN